MPENKQKTNSFLKRISPYMVGAFTFFIILAFIFKDVSEILIVFGLLAALSFVYALGYIIVIIYEKLEKKRKA
ncbi:MAG: hypothetical protein JSU85_01010 [Candidatus Zixiibacteriota bacterium]|nr:MAG: hypothetical protein JSU85_01010 [candidate division Zixibacteria bacterium]